jgi:hypothetical protein
MTVSDGTYIAAMLAELGWRVPDLGADRYPRFAWSQELVDGLDAVLLVDGEMMSWYGSRALAGLRYLRQVRDMVEGAG